MIDDLNDEVTRSASTWISLRTTDDPALDITIVDFDKRTKMFDGEPVLSRKSRQPRIEWVFTGTTPDGDTVRCSLNESAQQAVRDSINALGKGAKAEEGDRLQLKVKENPPDDRSQAIYAAKWTKGAKPLDIDTDDMF